MNKRKNIQMIKIAVLGAYFILSESLPGMVLWKLVP